MPEINQKPGERQTLPPWKAEVEETKGAAAQGERVKAYALEEVRRLAGAFCLEGAVLSVRPYGGGHINDTFLVKTEGGKRYILQRISHELTKDPASLMENIQAVTAHLRKKVSDPRGVLHLIQTREGKAFLSHPSGAWRIYDFVEGTVCLSPPQPDEIFVKSARAFGAFIEQMGDFPAQTLHDTIPNFHNTPERFRQLHAALTEDSAGRVREVGEELDFLLSREREAGGLYDLLSTGELPLRVTHNDTKLDNILFDKNTLEPVCIIDLDTVMAGLSLYDFGDSIRSGAATAPEDERDLNKVSLHLGRYHLYREGFLSACPGLTPLERELLPQGAKTITLEQGARFLTDYLNGDVYYHTAYAGHNLVRCRTQLKLVKEMEEHWEEMWG